MAPLAVGDRVRVKGLSAKPQLNGLEGVCLEAQQDGERWTVMLDTNGTYSLKVNNLLLLPPPPPPRFRLVPGSASVQGMRASQEDRHVKIPDLAKAAQALKMPVKHLGDPCALFAVFDGHQGHRCSDFAARGLHLRLLKRLTAEPQDGWDDERLCAAMKGAFEDLDAEFLTRHRTAPDGSTAVAALIAGGRLVLAHAGDSRGILCRKVNGEVQVAEFTKDHRCSNPAEVERIRQSGGEVVDVGDGAWRVAKSGYDERVRDIIRAEQQGLGMIGKPPVALAVCRALGDREFKAVTGGGDVVTATPEVQCIHLTEEHAFLTMMSDGVTDVLSNEEVAAELSRVRDPDADPETDARAACGALLQEAMRRGSGDNLTAVLVRFVWRESCNGSGQHATETSDLPPAKKQKTAAPPNT